MLKRFLNSDSLTYIALAVIFALSYAFEPLYTPNQNVRFIFGLKAAGFGLLAEDWFANTLDPLRPFQWLVTFTIAYLKESWFYIYHFIFLVLYFGGFISLTSKLYNINTSFLKMLFYSVLIIFIHSGALKFGLQASWGWQLHTGVADQYILGNYFQTAVFGVFLALSIILFYFKRNYIAISLTALAAVFHSAYLLSAAILTFIFIIIVFWEEKKILKPLLMGALSFLIVLPTIYYLFTTFGATSPEISKKAFQIITEYRIPHHSKPNIWFFQDLCILKIVIIGYSLWLVRMHKRLFHTLLFSTLAALALTLYQVATKNHSLALIAPWRISAVIMPFSLFVVTGYWFNRLYTKGEPLLTHRRRTLLTSAITLLAVLVVSNGWLTLNRFKAKTNRPQSAIMNYVANQKHSGDVYFIPRNFYDFRIETGAPAFVDFKNHPYKDSEVLEWYNRLQFADRIYSEALSQKNISLMKERGITHIIWPTDKTLNYSVAYSDSHFMLLDINTLIF